MNSPLTGKKIVIFDLDGTLATVDARMQLATGGNSTESDYNKIDWSILHDPANIEMDKPNVPVVTMCDYLFEKGYHIYIFSGRSDKTQQATIEWLEKYQIKYHKLVMRPSATKEENFMPDEILKYKMLEQHADRDDILCVYDDRTKVVDMWRSVGLTCFQVAPGDF
jgi:hypothetical protein